MKGREIDPQMLLDYMEQNPVGEDFVTVANGYAREGGTRKMSYNVDSFRVERVMGVAETEMIYSGQTAALAIQLFNQL